MNRRRFLRQSGIWIPAAMAFPAIVRAQLNRFHDPAFTAEIMRRPSSSATFDPTVYAMWVEATHAYTDGGITPAANGELVQQVNDQSGHSINGTSATTRRPTYASAGFGVGKPGLTFNGTSNNFYFTPGAISQPITFIAAMNMSNTGGAIVFNDATGRSWRQDMINFGTQLDHSLTTGAPIVYVAVANNTSSVIYENNVQVKTGTAGSTGISNVAGSIMSREGADALWISGTWFAFGIYAGILSDANRLLATNYCKAAMGI